jgi:hypothetical protein
MFIVTGTAHNPAVGVKVYVTVPATAVLIDVGAQDPVTPFVDVVGSVGAALF